MAFIVLLIQTLVQTVLTDKKNMTLFNFEKWIWSKWWVYFLPLCCLTVFTQPQLKAATNSRVPTWARCQSLTWTTYPKSRPPTSNQCPLPNSDCALWRMMERYGLQAGKLPSNRVRILLRRVWLSEVWLLGWVTFARTTRLRGVLSLWLQGVGIGGRQRLKR